MNWPRWHWLNDGLIPLLVILLRVCWVWPWLEMVRHWLTPSNPTPIVPLWALLGLFVLSTAVTRSALRKTQSLSQARAWVSGVGLVVVMGVLWWQVAARQYPVWDVRWLRLLAYALSDWSVAIPPSFLTLLVAVGVWVRGVLDGQRPLLRDAVWGAFTTGTLALALLLVAGHYDPDGLLPHSGRWLLGFFVVGLAALALSSLQLARAVGRWGSQKNTQMNLNRYWLLSVAVVILAMVGVGLLLGAIVTPGLVANLLSWVGVVLNWLGVLVGYVFLAVAYVLFLVLTPLIEWLRSLMSNEPPEQEETAEAMNWQQQLEELRQQPQTQLSPEVIESLRWLWLLLLVVGIVVAIAIALKLMKFGDTENEDESRESVFTRDMLKDQLASLWQSWMQRLQRPAQPDHDPYLSLTGEVENRRAIRSLYQALLSLAERRGLPRKPPQTPLDYGATLETAYPADTGAWQTLTEAYMSARYAERPPSDEEVDRARQAWAHLAPRLESDPDGLNRDGPGAPDGTGNGTGEETGANDEDQANTGGTSIR